jgi:uncharacterized membrane protein YkvA (DUF1232 family)
MTDDAKISKFEENYSERSFWEKLMGVAKTAGSAVVEKSLALHYCASDPDTPVIAKGMIYGALGYFILPVDAIPDVFMGVGYTDDLGVLAAAATAIATHMKPEHSERAKQTMKQWFG